MEKRKLSALPRPEATAEMVEMADRLDGMEHIVTAELVDDNKILLLNFYEVSKLKKGKTGDLLIATTSEDVEACCKAVAWLGDSEVAYSTDAYCFSHDQDPKFMAYLFQTEMFAKQKRMAATEAKVVRVSGEAMATFSFALPPLSKQREIARTLDIFEEYIQRLEKLISLRQKQYEYYREKLLTFE